MTQSVAMGLPKLDLVVLGAVLWDIFDDTKLIGGAPFNVAAHATRLGIRTAFVSAVGNDELGNEALENVVRLGLSTEYIRTVKGRPTGTVQVFLNEGQPDYDIIRPAAYDCAEIGEADIQDIIEAAPQWIYFGTLEPMSPSFMSMLQCLLAACRDARRFYDVNLRKESYTPELIEILLGETTVLKINDSELDAIRSIFDMPRSDDEEFCKVVTARFDLECVCVTRGERGCAIWKNDRFVECPGNAINLADAVGAGDAFSAALIYGLMMKWDLDRVADFANQLGALVASRHGGIPPWTLDEVMEF